MLEQKVSAGWPTGFVRIQRECQWVQSPIDELARNYDAVEKHGWYRNLDPVLDEMETLVDDQDIVIDYSAGTGILVEQFLKRVPDRQACFVLVDASAKFLRLALDKLGADQRIAFRWIQYLKSEQRLQRLDEVLPNSLRQRGVDLLCSTNAIHLYSDLGDTLQSWRRSLKPGGMALIQSGNIANPNAPDDSWIIDTTVERIQPIARALVQDRDQYTEFRHGLDDDNRMASYDRLRAKYFLPVRPLSYYHDALRGADFEIIDVFERAVDARVSDWGDFLSAYHEGILGWAGGSKRIEDREPSAETVALRCQLLRESLAILFEGRDSFPACWTYIKCRKPR